MLIRATDVPRISPEFLAAERRTMTAARYRQEYEASFEETEDSVFRNDDIQAAFSDDVAPLFGKGSAA